MTPELERLRAEAKHRYHTDAAFHARVKLAVQVEEELDRGPAARDTWHRYERLDRLVTVLHALDQEEAHRASIRYVGPDL